MKDFAKSWEQIEWQNAADTHKRMHGYLVANTSNKAICDYAKKRISDLELKFPQLKGN